MWRVKHEERNQRVKCEEKWKEHREGKRERRCISRRRIKKIRIRRKRRKSRRRRRIRNRMRWWWRRKVERRKEKLNTISWDVCLNFGNFGWKLLMLNIQSYLEDYLKFCTHRGGCGGETHPRLQSRNFWAWRCCERECFDGEVEVLLEKFDYLMYYFFLLFLCVLNKQRKVINIISNQNPKNLKIDTERIQWYPLHKFGREKVGTEASHMRTPFLGIGILKN